jgi:hypothetical protein
MTAPTLKESRPSPILLARGATVPVLAAVAAAAVRAPVAVGVAAAAGCVVIVLVTPVSTPVPVTVVAAVAVRPLLDVDELDGDGVDLHHLVDGLVLALEFAQERVAVHEDFVPGREFVRARLGLFSADGHVDVFRFLVAAALAVDRDREKRVDAPVVFVIPAMRVARETADGLRFE